MAKSPPSIIETMAEEFYNAWKRDGKVVVNWPDLNPEDRQRFVDGMIEAVRRVPDHCHLRQDNSSTTIIIGEGRQAIFQEHREVGDDNL
ncbi:MAG: hypothetical protein ACRBM6_38610 [Geminicoccales bacterium]